MLALQETLMRQLAQHARHGLARRADAGRDVAVHWHGMDDRGVGRPAAPGLRLAQDLGIDAVVRAERAEIHDPGRRLADYLRQAPHEGEAELAVLEQHLDERLAGE